MPCYHPLTAYRRRSGRNNKGRWPITFNMREGYKDKEIKVPCGQCIGCRLEYSRKWAIRCMHEADTHELNCFLTLTYEDKFLSKNNSLNKTDIQKFFKKLRKRVFPKKLRYFQCGEYGDKSGRPHHHALIFGWRPDDLELFSTRGGYNVYESAVLNNVWKLGFVAVGDVTFDSAAYVARYVIKKVSGDKALLHYSSIVPETGEIINERLPEFVTMSRRPGIGYEWFKRYKSDVYPSDTLVVTGRGVMKPPRYYDDRLEFDDPKLLRKIKARRLVTDSKVLNENKPWRLSSREEVKKAQVKQLKRIIERE